jgi:hypothetical protein
MRVDHDPSPISSSAVRARLVREEQEVDDVSQLGEVRAAHRELPEREPVGLLG